MSKLFAALAGWKTYIVGAGTIVGAISAELSGSMTWQQAAAVIVPAILGMTIRHGVSKQTEALLEQGFVIAANAASVAIASQPKVAQPAPNGAAPSPAAITRALLPIGLIVALGAGLSACTAAENQLQKVQTFTVDDLKAADADAVAHGDVLAHQCYPVLITVVQSLPMPVPSSSPVGAASAFQAARDVVKAGEQVAGGLSSATKMQIAQACGPLALDAQNDLNDITAKLGIGVLATQSILP